MSQLSKPIEIALGNDQLEKMDLRTILYPLWLNKWLIALITSVCLMIGIIQAILVTPLYSSNVLLQFQDRSTSSLLSLPAASFLSPKGASTEDVQTALIKSRYILMPVVRRLQLDLIVTPQYSSVFGQWYARRHANTLEKPWWGKSTYAWGGEQIRVSQFDLPTSEEKQSFTLIAGSPNHYQLYTSQGQLVLTGDVGKTATAMLAGKGVIKLRVEELHAGVNTHFNLMRQSTQRVSDNLAGQIVINDLSKEMQLANDTGILKISMIGQQPKAIIDTLNAIADVVVEKSAKKKLEEDTQTLAFMKQQLPLVKKSLNEAEEALNRYLAKEHMLDISSESRLLVNQIGEVQKNLSLIAMNKQIAKEKYTSAHPYFISLNAKEKAYQSQLASLQVQASELPVRDQPVVGLMRDVRVKSQLYLVLLNKIQSLEVVKGGTVSDAEVIGDAIIPEAPLPSGRLTILMFSLLAGIALGVAIIYIRRLWHNKISDPAIIETRFGLTSMAIVPYSDGQKTLWSTRSRQTLLPLLAQCDPKDLTVEALRSFRTSLQFAMIGAANNRVTITGVAPGVGKSFISVNFAYLLADAGKKVLLIDGDIRKGYLKDYFTSGQKVKGLTEVVCGACSLEEALIHGPIENLDLLAAGTYPPNPSELLMSQPFKDLLESASKLYDLVIIDTAPILAVTDAAVIAHLTGTSFLVLASDTHETEEIELALKRFSANGVRMNGVVFNFSKQQKGLYRYGHVQKYQYEYN